MNKSVKEKVDETREWLKNQGLAKKYEKPGIYSISIEDKLVYIGKSVNMLERITSHLVNIEIDKKSNKYKVLRNAQNQGLTIKFDVVYCAIEEDPTAICDEIGHQEAKLIREYLPPLNYQIPKLDNYRSFEVNRTAKYITLQQIMSDKYFIF